MPRCGDLLSFRCLSRLGRLLGMMATMVLLTGCKNPLMSQIEKVYRSVIGNLILLTVMLAGLGIAAAVLSRLVESIPGGDRSWLGRSAYVIIGIVLATVAALTAPDIGRFVGGLIDVSWLKVVKAP